LRLLARTAMAFVLVACSADHSTKETGVLLRIAASESLREAISSLRVRVQSGDMTEDASAWPERADEMVDVATWPAEVFIRVSDSRRGWHAEIWGDDGDGNALAYAEAGGRFSESMVRQQMVTLDACDGECRSTAHLDAGEDLDASVDSGRDASSGPSGPVMCGTNLCADECPASRPAHCCASGGRCACYSAADNTCYVSDAMRPDAGTVADAAEPTCLDSFGRPYVGLFSSVVQDTDGGMSTYYGTLSFQYTRAALTPHALSIEQFHLRSSEVDAAGAGQFGQPPDPMQITAGTLAGSFMSRSLAGSFDGHCTGRRNFEGSWSFVAGSTSGQGRWEAIDDSFALDAGWTLIPDSGAANPCTASACTTQCTGANPIRCCTSVGTCGCARDVAAFCL